MLRKLLVLSGLLVSSLAQASDVAFLLHDVKSQKTIISEGHVDEPIPPCSTFKVLISLVGFEEGILKDADSPVWKHTEVDLSDVDDPKNLREAEMVPLSPKKWMEVSSVWFSQNLTRNLDGADRTKALAKLQSHVDRVNYGNRNLAGDPGKNNGLTRSWLCSSLLITPKGQLAFLNSLVNETLGDQAHPYKPHTYATTKEIMGLGDLNDGWKLYGKTGSGYMKAKDGGLDRTRKLGWFIGWLEGQGKNVGQIYTFVYQINNLSNEKQPGGPFAKEQALKLLREKFA